MKPFCSIPGPQFRPSPGTGDAHSQNPGLIPKRDRNRRALKCNGYVRHFGMDQKLKSQGYTGFRPWFHLPSWRLVHVFEPPPVCLFILGGVVRIKGLNNDNLLMHRHWLVRSTS